MKSITLFLIISALLICSSTTSPCSEAFSMTDIALDTLQRVFEYNDYGMLYEVFGFLHASLDYIETSCVEDFKFEMIEIPYDDPRICSAIRSLLLTELTQFESSSFNTESYERQAYYSLLQKVLSFSSQIAEYNCQDEWSKDLFDEGAHWSNSWPNEYY